MLTPIFQADGFFASETVACKLAEITFPEKLLFRDQISMKPI